MHWESILKEFMYETQIRNYTWKTQKSYRNNITAFFTYSENVLSVTDVENILSQHIKLYFEYLRKKGCKQTYTNGILKTIRGFFKYCFDEGYITVNPCLKVSWAKEPKTVILAFTDEEVSKMMKIWNKNNYLSIRNRVIMAMLFDTGIRCWELCCLKMEDIRETFIVIHDGKGAKERIVGQSQVLARHIIKYQRVRESFFLNTRIKYDNFFLSRTGRPLTNEAVLRIVKQTAEQAKIGDGVRCSPHTCRHYFAQAMLRNGMDVYSLSRLMGHENITITKRYLQSIQDKDIIKMSVTYSPLMNL